jgi:hypothetical protein
VKQQERKRRIAKERTTNIRLCSGSCFQKVISFLKLIAHLLQPFQKLRTIEEMFLQRVFQQLRQIEESDKDQNRKD